MKDKQKHLHYFAYGYNMSTKRLKDRVGEIDVIGKAKLKNYHLTFNKLGDNGSGKANIEPKKDSFVEGVIFNLTKKQIKKLDKYERFPHHYIRCKMEVIQFDNSTVITEIYTANQNKIRGDLKPKCEYLRYLIDGANEHGLSKQYKQFLSSVEFT